MLIDEAITVYGGVAARCTLLATGVLPSQIARALAAGRLVKLRPGVYRHPEADLTWLAAAAALTGGALSHSAAASVWGLDLVHAHRAEVSVNHGRSRVSASGVVVHRARLAPGDVLVVDASASHLARPLAPSTSPVPEPRLADDDSAGATIRVRVTSPLRTVLDCARSMPLLDAVVIADSALRRRLISMAQLRRAAERASGPNSAQLRRVAALADDGSASMLESVTRVILAEAGLRPPRSQHPVLGATGQIMALLDFAWPELLLAVETDGFEFHGTREQYRRDRRRGNLLTAHGWTVLHFSYEDVMLSPDYVVATVRAQLAAATASATARRR